MLPTPAMNPSRPQLSRYGWRPVDPPPRPVLFVNPRSGGGKAARGGIAERARHKGIEAVVLAPGQDLAALAREAVAAGADAVGMAGARRVAGGPGRSGSRASPSSPPEPGSPSSPSERSP